MMNRLNLRETNTSATVVCRICKVSTMMMVAAAMTMTVALPGLRGTALAAPQAGTVIGNQASATYTDGSGTSRTATSNTVQTIVQQVAAMTLTANGSLTAGPGAQVVFPHTLTNTGNGTDTFSLTAIDQGGDSFDFGAGNIQIYADADGNGVPDNATPISSSGAVAAGVIFQFVVVGNVPGTATATQTGLILATGTSVFDGTVTASNTDTTTVSTNAVIAATKAMSVTSGAPGSGPHTITLTYTNNGLGTGTNVTLTDIIPAGMTYVGGSGRWSTTGATVLTDLSATDPQGTAPDTIIYDFNVTSPNRVTAVINQIPAGFSGTVTFQVTINSPQAAGLINNTAVNSYNDGAANVGPFNTNTVGFTVTQTVGVTANDNPLQAGDVLLDDIVDVPTAGQGATVIFNNRITNTGNGTDTFDVTLGASTFPAGTSFVLYQSDGVTPLTNSGGTAAPDTGPVASGATYTVVVRATLPAGASGGGPYTVTKTATSVADSLISDTVVDRLGTITTQSVDLQNSGGVGAGPGPEVSPVTTISANPGATATFQLIVNNTGGAADSFDLAASTDSTFAAITLPSGWSVVFRDVSSAVITNTGTIAAAGSVTVNAEVIVGAGQAAIPPPGQSIFFRALSPVTGALDRKHDAVVVNTVRSLTNTPNNTGQVFPGGSFVYAHTLTNNGNVVEGNGIGSATSLSLTNDQAGWTSAVHWDQNNNGVLDGSDPVVSDLTFLSGGTAGLAPGESVNLLVQVVAAAGAPIGQVNTTTLTATTTGVINTVAAPAPAAATDQSTVLAGQITLLKEQALDATCDGTPDTPYAAGSITAGAIPGACIRYRVTTINVGAAGANSVVVTDSTPPNSVFDDGSRDAVAGTCGTGPVDAPATTTVGGITAPACDATGTVTATVGTLTPSQSAVVTYGIMINP